MFRFFTVPTWAIVNAVLPFFPKSHPLRKDREHPWIPLAEWSVRTNALARSCDLALWAYALMLVLLLASKAQAFESNRFDNSKPLVDIPMKFGPNVPMDYFSRNSKPSQVAAPVPTPRQHVAPRTGVVKVDDDQRGPHGLSCDRMHYTYVLSPNKYLAGPGEDGNASSYYGASVTVRKDSKIVYQDAGMLEDAGLYSELVTKRYTFSTGYKGNSPKVIDNASKRCLCSDGSAERACPVGTAY